MRRRLASAVAVMACALAGCATLTAADRAPRGDPVARLAATGPAPWTEDLGDPVLRDLLARADAGALDVKTALAHLERADADLEAAEAAGRLRISIGVAGAIGGRTLRQTRSAATPTFEGAYDVDLWHRFARGRSAARADRKAAAWDVEAARLLVGAETVRAYAAMHAAGDTQAAAFRRRDTARAALGLMSLRVSGGAASAREIDPQDHALAAADAQAEQARAVTALQAARLGDLTGQTGPAPGPLGMPSMPAPRGAVASTDVDGRPDVKAAFARLTAADERRAAAVLASRPQFQVAAALGAPDAAIATLLDVRALAWAVAGTAAREVLDGGARRAQVHLASAEADLADLAYRQAVMAGWSQVRAAVAGEADAVRQLSLAEHQLGLARAARRAGEARHAAGVADGLAMAALAELVEAASDAVRQAWLQAVEARIQRVLATGGR